MMNSMPTDLILEIFSRLPAKSVAVCCCVSKLWASILNSQDFRELFLTRSSSRPRLLFAIQGLYNNWRFFSSPQPHYSSDKSSHVVTADSYMKYLEDMRRYFCSYASGLMCFRQSRWIRKETELYIVHVICNPSTGQYDLLPKLILNFCGDWTSFLGFDPVDRQFKLRMWVVEKQKRSEYVYNLPKNEFVGGNVSVVGMTARGEIVLISDYTYLVLYVLYFNPESNTLQSVTIQDKPSRKEEYNNIIY
ncbi:hypothetical protein F2Q68_00016512 [Brassica cretica]|uniref:F-box domain-containing protein n=1 Tax=Brassica cretica TaxID=69181 RepID=A0A8S9HJI1_BRACR|nr:hypothetical protein F2Q68_00016512 [Brassica cretica]